MKIFTLTKYFKKSSYALILPYMDQIAPFIITRLSSQPDLLSEACRVMSIAPIDFIGITLPRTLPELFASCDQRVLELIAKELSTKASSLLLKHSHGILAHIFLSNQATTTKALNFVIKVLTDATSAVIDIQSVVKSCVVPLLAELVIVMGDERPEVAQNVCAFTSIRTNSLVNKLLGSCCLEESRASPCHCKRQNLSTRTFGRLPQNIHAWTHLRYQRHATRCPRQEVRNGKAQDSAKSGSIGIRDRPRRP